MRSQQLLDERGFVRVPGGLGAVPGFRLAGVHSGLKKRKHDLALIVADSACAAAACTTTNDVKAAPVIVSAENLCASGRLVRAILCNSGCANACTGARGIADARASAAFTADAVGCAPEEVLVASTGVIGVPLAMEAVKRGVGIAVERLAEGSQAGLDAAVAITTTDQVIKTSAYVYFAGDRRFVVGGIAKGSGMIAPDLATMLAFIGTNASVGSTALQAALSTACEESFNMISVDGAMSTNDAVYALAPPHPDSSFLPDGFAEGLACVCQDLAVAMARDGEGATKLLEVRVGGAASRSQARAIARAIVNSNLVKSALFGEDPNWGRIISAAGAAKAGFPSSGWCILLNGSGWVRDGREVLSEEQAHYFLAGHEISIDVVLGLGSEYATSWGCDLTNDYVKINAHYRS